MINDLSPPHNIEAEQSVIGSMLLDNEMILEVAEILRPDDFFRGTHQILYQAILNLNEKSGRFDIVLLVEELTRQGNLEKAGGEVAIREAIRNTPSPANAKFYAQVVKQRSVAREIQEAAYRSLEEISSNNHTSDELLESAEKRIFAIGQRTDQREPVSGHEVCRDAVARARDRKENRLEGGLMTGFVDLDSLTGGFKSDQMIVIAARPSVGKTALALCMADHVASRGVGVLFVSLEMNKGDIGDRLLSLRTKVAASTIQQSRFANEEEMGRLERAALPPNHLLWIDDSPILTATQIAARARRSKAKHDIGLVVLDYLQLVQPEDARRPREEQVATSCGRLRAMARETKAPVLVLCQLNRDIEKRSDKTPLLSDLRESGRIEQDSDVIIFLDKPSQHGVIDLHVAKNRNGPTNKVSLAFENTLMRFSNLDRWTEQNF